MEKEIKSLWFSGMYEVYMGKTTGIAYTIGIVKVKDKFSIKYYIGIGKGLDEEEDTRFIENFGAPFPEHAGNILFGEPS